MEAYAGQQFVGIDLHRRRSVIVRTTERGDPLETVRISNDVDSLTKVMARAGVSPEVVLEATYGWYWAADVLAALGASVHLAHPLGVKAFSYRRVKNDVRDATDLADLLRMGRLPEAWIAPPVTRELRELVRHRAKLVAIRSGCKCEIHAVLAKCGVQVLMSDLFADPGTRLLERLDAPAPYLARVGSLRRLIDDLDVEVDLFARLVRGRLVTDPGYRAVQQIPGIGPTLGAVFVAEIGDVHPVPRTGAAGLLGGVDPEAPRVRHPRAPGPDHQAGIPAGAVGGDRVGPGPRPGHRRRTPETPRRRPPRPQHRQDRRRPPTVDLRVLRDAGRARPFPPPLSGRRMSAPILTSWPGLVVQVMTPAPRRGRAF